MLASVQLDRSGRRNGSLRDFMTKLPSKDKRWESRSLPFAKTLQESSAGFFSEVFFSC